MVALHCCSLSTCHFGQMSPHGLLHLWSLFRYRTLAGGVVVFEGGDSCLLLTGARAWVHMAALLWECNSVFIVAQFAPSLEQSLTHRPGTAQFKHLFSRKIARLYSHVTYLVHAVELWLPLPQSIQLPRFNTKTFGFERMAGLELVFTNSFILSSIIIILSSSDKVFCILQALSSDGELSCCTRTFRFGIGCRFICGTLFSVCDVLDVRRISARWHLRSLALIRLLEFGLRGTARLPKVRALCICAHPLVCLLLFSEWPYYWINCFSKTTN